MMYHLPCVMDDSWRMMPSMVDHTPMMQGAAVA